MFGSRVYADVFERMLRLHVAPPSGDGTTSFVLWERSKVRELNRLAKPSFGKSSIGKGVLRLVTSEGGFLDDPDETLEHARLQDGDHLTTVEFQVITSLTRYGYACPSCDAPFVKWSACQCHIFSETKCWRKLNLSEPFSEPYDYFGSELQARCLEKAERLFLKELMDGQPSPITSRAEELWSPSHRFQ